MMMFFNGGHTYILFFFGLMGVVIEIIMMATVIQSERGKIVSINTIKGIGLAGIIISVLMFLISNPFAALVLLGASICYRLSIKNISIAKIGVALGGFSIVIIVFVFLANPAGRELFGFY